MFLHCCLLRQYEKKVRRERMYICFKTFIVSNMFVLFKVFAFLQFISTLSFRRFFLVIFWFSHSVACFLILFAIGCVCFIIATPLASSLFPHYFHWYTCQWLLVFSDAISLHFCIFQILFKDYAQSCCVVCTMHIIMYTIYVTHICLYTSNRRLDTVCDWMFERDWEHATK